MIWFRHCSDVLFHDYNQFHCYQYIFSSVPPSILSPNLRAPSTNSPSYKEGIGKGGDFNEAIGTFRFEYEYKIEYEYDFSIFFRCLDNRLSYSLVSTVFLSVGKERERTRVLGI